MAEFRATIDDRVRWRFVLVSDDALSVRVTLNKMASDVFDYSATINVNGNRFMRDEFQLMNIRASVQQGT